MPSCPPPCPRCGLPCSFARWPITEHVPLPLRVFSQRVAHTHSAELNVCCRRVGLEDAGHPRLQVAAVHVPGIQGGGCGGRGGGGQASCGAHPRCLHLRGRCNAGCCNWPSRRGRMNRWPCRLSLPTSFPMECPPLRSPCPPACLPTLHAHALPAASRCPRHSQRQRPLRWRSAPLPAPSRPGCWKAAPALSCPPRPPCSPAPTPSRASHKR